MTAPREPRLRRRRRLVIATILPALVLVVVALRLLTLPVNIGTAQAAHGEGDGPGMVAAGEKLGILNLVERWRAPFVEGTGAALAGDLDGGRADLEVALARTGSAEDDCTVRTNLVITISRQADEAKEDGDVDAERKRAKEGLKVIDAGPAGCLDGSNDGNDGDAGRALQEEQKKLEEQSGAEGPEESEDPEDEGDEGDEDDGEEDPQQQELQERNEAGQQQNDQQRRDNEARKQGETGGVDRPW